MFSDTVDTLVAVTSRRVASRYRGFIEADDIAQEMRIWVLTHQDKLAEWLDVEEKEDFKAGVGALRLTLRRIGEQYSRQQKAAMAGYHTTDEYFYEVAVVEDLLPEAFGDQDGWVPAIVQDTSGNHTPRLMNEGNDRWAKVADVSSALRKVSNYDYTILEQHYRFNQTFRAIAEYLECSKSKAQRDCESALGHLVKELGGRSPWTDKDRVYRRRSVVSNAQAQAAVEI